MAVIPSNAARSELAMLKKHFEHKAVLEAWITASLSAGSRLLFFQSKNDYTHYVSRRCPLPRDYYARAIIYLSDIDGVLYIGSRDEEFDLTVKLPGLDEMYLGLNKFGDDCLRLTWSILGKEACLGMMYRIIRRAHRRTRAIVYLKQ